MKRGRLSIRSKLAAIGLLTSVTALALACVSLFTYEVLSFRRTLVRDLGTQATMLAGLSTAALSFDDKATAEEMLGELKGQPHIQWAVIFKDGHAFAHYRNPRFGGAVPATSPAGFGATFDLGGLQLHTEIRLKGERLGTLQVGADTSQLNARLREYGQILLLVSVVACTVALFLASRLQRMISGPVRRLDEAARLVAEQKDYSVRVVQEGEDELGRLTAAFNHMLTRIQAQDTELREGRERFEIAVAGSRDGIWDWNLLNGAWFVSPQWKAMLGYGDADVPSGYEAWVELIHADDRAGVERALREYLDGKRAMYQLEFRMRHQDGSYRWILSRGAALRDAAGKPFRMAGSHTDITERKEAAGQIVRMQRELVDASRIAGMAEVATGVLHNVGNALNSVNLSASIVADRLRTSKIASLARAVGLMREHKDRLSDFIANDPKGRHLPGFIEALADELSREQRLLVREAQGLQQNVEHIKHIVAAQQTYAKASGVQEHLVMADLVETALQMSEASQPGVTLAIVREFSSVPTVVADRHKVLQILVNLIGNARQALEATADPRRIVLRIASVETHRVIVEVSDNGVGISPENLTRIFSHGFTTKPNGHGFGLHSGANAAREMGGTLHARSPGLGLGSTFTLELPVQGISRNVSERSRGGVVASSVTTPPLAA